MIIEQLRNLLILGVIVVVIIGVNWIYKSNNPICPDNIENAEQRTSEFKKWINNFYENNPNTSTDDVIDFRRSFLAKNNCKEALRTYNFYITTSGKVAEEITEAEGAIKAEMLENQAQSVCPLDFENQDEYVESAANWLSNYYKKNPQASEEEVLKARMDYLLKIGCVDMKFVDNDY